MRTFKIGKITIGEELVLLAGPCVIESEKSIMRSAMKLKSIAEDMAMPLIFKSSYDKANRSSVTSFRGPGIKAGLRILRKVKEELDLPVLSDVHCSEEVEIVSGVLDMLQIPAFLCRQTDLILNAGRSGKPVNVKKGQFMAPWEVGNIIEKLKSVGNQDIAITERGTCFGYNNLIVDMRSFPRMRSFGFPVIFDATHSVQLPGAGGSVSSGERDFILPLARAAVAAGCEGLFIETHENPEQAKCDGANMVKLSELRSILEQVKSIDGIIRS